MPIQADTALRDRARTDVRTMLSKVQGFRDLHEKDQLQFYKDLLGARIAELRLQQEDGGVSRAAAFPPVGMPGMPPLPVPGAGGVQRASDSIDYDRLANKRIEQAGQLAGDFMTSVNFPGFVRDLLQGFFEANLSVTLKQMEAYINLMKAATASISTFINKIDSAASFGYLAENSSDEFGLADDPEEGQVLVDKEGNKVASLKQMKTSPDDVDATVKAKIMDAKIAMAKEQRALLRETILMGVSRLVVERGTVKAAVVFDIKAKETITSQQKAANKRSHSSSSGGTISGGFLGMILGGASGGTTDSDRSTEISVASAKGVGSTDLAAKVTGSVEIVFKSDYFKLDNFATMYGPVAPQNGAAAAAPGAARAAPPAPAPPPGK